MDQNGQNHKSTKKKHMNDPFFPFYSIQFGRIGNNNNNHNNAIIWNSSGIGTNYSNINPQRRELPDLKRVQDQLISCEPEKCNICFEDEAQDPVRPQKCSHIFCRSCIEQWINEQPICPVCRCKIVYFKGSQPSGRCYLTIDKEPLPGHTEETLVMHFFIPHGYQTSTDTYPGRFYKGCNIKAYLPANIDGYHVQILLFKAFESRLLFKLQSNSVQSNGIELKISKLGYPDPTYINRVREDLEHFGFH